ncbi:hypothetical protein NUH88_06125 [Nisaea acidiphila]|uniref:Lipoprotein n=1 Tax=Nisaea acidiphila TaxID=1862145 RepID=A0A9J7AWU6_9PROT|nr:hypothetical protein [Nisaea acidiphila]UUX51266.1 hypothetical protein NUH88_06125 [Nisaea acidiphila]
MIDSKIFRPGRTKSIAALALMILALSGCGDIPRPFGQEAYDKHHNDFLFVQEAAGIHVEPVDGPVEWVGKAMASAMSEALVEHSVVASDRARNRSSYVLKSSGYQQMRDSGPPELIMKWVLNDPSGEVIGEKSFTSVPPLAFWETPEPAHFKDIADQTAPEVAAWLIPALGPQLLGDLPPVYLDLIDGPGGPGNGILRQTMLRQLQSRGVEIVESSAIPEGALTLDGRIDIKPLDGKTDRVAISWRLADASEREIGTIDQSNAVPAGTMDESWLGAAPLIVDGALEGLMPLLKAYKRQRIGGNAVTKRQ